MLFPMVLVPLRARSRFSLGFGTASVEELTDRAAELGLPSLALTDIETLAGQVRFHDACAARGIKPITGVELRSGHSRHAVGAPSGRLTLLARDEEGYSSLCRIVSLRHVPPRPVTDEPLGSLKAGVAGLFLLTDDLALLRRLLQTPDVDRANVGLLLTRPTPKDTERAAKEAAEAARVPLVADLDASTLDGADRYAGDRSLHTLLLAIRHRITVAEARRLGLDAAGRRTLDGDALAQFDDLPDAAEQAKRIADACNLDLAHARRIHPRLPELSADEAAPALRERCRVALSQLRSSGRLTGTEYDSRLERELDTITRLGFADYFLAVSEIVRGARGLGVATAGRGSAAGSLVAFLLGITEIDPVEADLLFERFLHERREAPPDIDLDVASIGRDSLNDWVVRRFGRERVAGIATHATFRARSAVRSGLAALGVARGKIDTVLRRLDPGDASGEQEAALVERTLRESLIDEVRWAAPLIRRLVGIPSHVAAHPGGIVIGDGPLEELVPLERAPGGTVVTQFEHQAVERAGFLKIDLLGNHFLSEMQQALAALPPGTKIPEDDERTWRTLDHADTVGCFQVESPAVRSVLRRLPMREFPDLVAALAVVRPGAAAGAAKERFVRRARGEEPFETLEILGAGGRDARYAGIRERLARSRGVLLYDEDIIRLLATVGGTSLAAADELRTAIVAAGEAPEELARLGSSFIERAVGSGADIRVAERAWEAASRFASYSFAEAHAASYAVLAWKAAWLRTHAPLEFGRALIDHHRALYPLRTIAAAVQRWGVRLLPPSVGLSQLESTVELVPAPAVRVGLAALKGLTKRTAGDLLTSRPFADLGELIERARPARRELRTLLLSGACDDLPPLSPEGYPLVHEVVLEGMAGEAGPAALGNVLERVERFPSEGGRAEELRSYRRLVRVRNEIRFLDMHLSDHPMRLLRPEAERLGCLSSRELQSRPDRFVRFAGLLAASRRVPTSQGELRFLTFEDEDGLIEGVLFPEANARLGGRITTPGPYLAKGVMRETEGDLHLVVAGLTPFHERE
jgi:DNA-directed DNA polymerase III PolC